MDPHLGVWKSHHVPSVQQIHSIPSVLVQTPKKKRKKRKKKMEYSNLQRQAAITRKSLFDQGHLDEQFYQLEELQDEVCPNFVEEVVTLFFRDSTRLVSNIELALEKFPQDLGKLDSYMQQLKGSTSSIGASKLKSECTQFREYCDEGNVQGCLRSFQKVKREHAILRQKLESYFQLLRQAGPKERATRPNV